MNVTPQVRKLAAAADLANKNRKDSQGICFLGKVGRVMCALLESTRGVHKGIPWTCVGNGNNIHDPSLSPLPLRACTPVLLLLRFHTHALSFRTQVRFSEFVKEHLGEWHGPLLEAETGRPLGTHAGYWFYTVGQRGGIKLPGGPWWVQGGRRGRRRAWQGWWGGCCLVGLVGWLLETVRNAWREAVRVRHGLWRGCCDYFWP